MTKWIKGMFNNVITGLLVSFFGSSAVVTFLWKWISGTSGFKFLTNDHPVQGWVIVFIISGILVFILMLVMVFFRNRPWKEKKNYLSYGLFWDLTSQFFQNYDQFTASSVSSIFVRSCILGPYCPKCNVDVTNTIAGGSFVCMNGHDLKETEANKILDEYRRTRFPGTSDPEHYWDIIRARVYAEAQGKARNGLI